MPFHFPSDIRTEREHLVHSFQQVGIIVLSLQEPGHGLLLESKVFPQGHNHPGRNLLDNSSPEMYKTSEGRSRGYLDVEEPQDSLGMGSQGSCMCVCMCACVSMCIAYKYLCVCYVHVCADVDLCVCGGCI